MARGNIADDLLTSMFTPQEFARWADRCEAFSSEVIAALPPAMHLSPASYFSDVVALLTRHGQLTSHDFYCNLLAVRPRRAADISTIAAIHGQLGAVAIAEELVFHAECRFERAWVLSNRGGWSQTTCIYRLDDAIRERGKIEPGDPRRAWIDEQIAMLSKVILIGPRPVAPLGSMRSEGEGASQLRAWVPQGDDPDRLSMMLVPRSSSSLAVFVKSALVTFVTGLVLGLAVKGLWQPPSVDRGAPPPKTAPKMLRSPSVSETVDAPVRPSMTVAPTRSSVIPASSAIPASPTKSARTRSSRSGAPQQPSPGQGIPPLVKHLSIEHVNEGLAALRGWSASSARSVRLAVRPNGMLDMRRLDKHKISPEDMESLERLRFPPTAMGSDEMVCHLVVGDLKRTRVRRFECHGP